MAGNGKPSSFSISKFFFEKFFFWSLSLCCYRREREREHNTYVEERNSKKTQRPVPVLDTIVHNLYSMFFHVLYQGGKWRSGGGAILENPDKQVTESMGRPATGDIQVLTHRHHD